MKRLTLFLTSLFIMSGVMADVNYTPTNTGARERQDKFVSSVSVNGNTFTLSTDQRSSEYVDATTERPFIVKSGNSVALEMQGGGENDGWMNAYVYIDKDKNGFDAGIADNGYTPTFAKLQPYIPAW